MTTVLGRDLGADAYSRFGGRLFAATLRHEVPDPIVDPTNVTSTPFDYTCDAYAFSYKQEYVDGERVLKGDYQVVILRGSIAMSNDDGERANINLGAFTPDVDTVLEAVAEGVGGNALTVELVGDALAGAGTIAEVGTNTRIGFLPGVTTVADVEALIAASLNVRVLMAGTPGNVLGGGDQLAATPLAGGAAPTATPVDLVPAPGDRITVPPPGQTTPINARIIEVDAVTEAQITVHVRGPKAA